MTFTAKLVIFSVLKFSKVRYG